jgi:hypothetical protein
MVHILKWKFWDVTGAMMGLIELTGGEILLARGR